MGQKKIKQERKLTRETNERGGISRAMLIVPLVLVVAIGGYFLFKTKQAPSVQQEVKTAEVQTNNMEQATKQEGDIAVIETAKGNIVVKLRPDAAPKTVQNFLGLVEKKFYDGLKFHRVEPNFVIQGGDPKGDGTGGSDANIPLEIKCKDGTMTEGQTATCEPLLKHADGALAMARTNDPNSATSQFYITNGAQPDLDGNYAVFGYVTEGMDAVRAIQRGDVMKRVYVKQ